MKKNFKLLLLTLIMGGGLFASEAMALDQDNYGVYQIGTADDFEAFAKLINEGNSNQMKLNAVLTADIDLRSKGNCMIGTIGHTYGGEFDGQGHTITIDYKHDTSLDMDEGELGLIRRLRDGTVKNLLVNGNITTCNKCAGGIVSGIWYTGTIENCVSNVTITDSGSGDATHGGILARISNKSNITIKNCAFYGTIEASDREGSGGIIGWADYGNSENAETKIMNCVMGGTLHLKKNKDNDVFVRNNVSITNSYYVAQQDMNNTNNTSVSQKDLNALKNALGSDWSEIYNGAAPLPNQFVPTKNSDNYYELSTASHMRQFAELVNNSNNSANGKMMNDINLSNIWTPIGNNDHRYAGTFDGQFHMINNLTVDLNQENVGIFGIVQSCTIKNLISGPNNSFKGTKGVGGIIGKGDGGGDNGIKLTCVGNESAVYATSQDAGGLIGYISHLSQDVTITNCYNTGNVKAGDNENNHEAAAIAGWLGQKTVSIKGFWNTGSITGSEYGNALWRNGDGSVTKERIYNLHNIDNGATKFTQDQLSNGELCYLLNNSSSEIPVWHQTLGTDNYPVPFSSGHKVIYNHTDFYSNIKTISGGFFEITNADDLESFAYTVNSGNTTAKGKLTTDIDMSGYNNFPGIGGSKTTDSDPNPICFAGVLDGDFHKIMNLKVDKTGLEAVGLVNSATAGATIKNLTIASTCEFKGRKAVGAFVGGTYNSSGTVTFLNCGNEGSVTSDGQNAGGILGCNFNGNIAIHMTNCYNIGTIKGNESGGISGWLSNNPVLRNCYNMGEVDGNDYFARMNNDGASLTNCFDSKSTWEALSSTTENNGNSFNVATVFTTCFDDAQGGSVWRMEFDGTPHPVLYDAAIVYKEDFPNRPVAQNTAKKVKLYRTTVAETWNTFSVPFALTKEQVDSVFGGKAKVAVLTSDDNDILHFTNVDAIEAGKAYLVKPTEANAAGNYKEIWVTVTKNNPETPETAYGGFKFIGVFAPTTLTGNEYVMTTNKETGGNTIKGVNTGTEMKGFRAYLNAVSLARATSFVIDDEGTTGIITATGDVIENGKMYNLGGQRVKEPQHGLYIVNGKKYIK